MGLVGFVPDAPEQSPAAMTGMRVAYSLVPILGTLLAMAVMWKYDLSERKANEIRDQLQRQRESTEIGLAR